MFQKYYDTNLMITFIKNLVGSTYIPNVPVWKPDSYIINDGIYLTKDYILRAKQSYEPSGDSMYGGGPRSELDSRYFDIIDKYIDNTSNYGLCSKYTSSTSYYDSKTHYYLGQYLRMQRDMYNLDLMAYYNCWCGEYSDKIRIKFDYASKQYLVVDDNNTDDGLKTLLVPIKYNQKYSLYINSNYNIMLAPVIIINNTITTLNKPIQIQSSNFFNPILYDGVNKSTYSESTLTNELEKYLYLIIQVSNEVSSHVVILEGNYLNNKLISLGKFGGNTSGVTNILTKLYYSFYKDNEQIDIYSYPKLIDQYCITSPSLIHMASNISYAFDDRLVEYLLLNVIDNTESVDKNIDRIQRYLMSTDSLIKNKITTYIIKNNTDIKSTTDNFRLDTNNYSKYMKGVWDNQLRMFIYDLITQHWKAPKTIDISGYVDKDVETIIGDIT